MIPNGRVELNKFFKWERKPVDPDDPRANYDFERCMLAGKYFDEEHGRKWLKLTRGYTYDEITPEAVKRFVRKANAMPKKQQPCYVCKGYELITQGHHIVDVGGIARSLFKAAIFDWAPKIPTAFLCPNHHTIYHTMTSPSNKKRTKLFKYITKAEYEALVELNEWGRNEFERIDKELRAKIVEYGWALKEDGSGYVD